MDPTRTWVATGRERHVEIARADYSPYPQRAIHTAQHLFIVNFHPERWPLGDPYGLDGDSPPTASQITATTRVTLPDDDAGPTKAWLVGQRNSPEWKSHFDWVYGKRPKYELYDLRKDPHETKNVAEDPAYATIKAQLEKQLMDELSRTGDPRLIDNGKFFETPPMAGPLPDESEFWNKDKQQPKPRKLNPADGSK